MVDLDARSFERWTPGGHRPELLNRELVWHPVATVPPLAIDLVRYFTEVWS